MQDKLLTTKEAAPLINVSVAFLERDRWIGAQVPYIRVGARAVRYRLSDLNAFIESRKYVSTVQA